jgi:HD-GYP domain-containing protein (c-di-GMP phosphodiesterase class II)
MPVGKAAAILRAGRGQQWDAALVDALLRSATVRDLAARRGETLLGVPLASDAAA